MNANRTAEQDTFQAQYALVTTVLKNAGVSDPEDVLRRLAQCGAISMSCDPECPAVVPVNKGVPCHYNSAAHDRPEQLEGPSTREGQSCGAPHFSSIKLPLSRGMSNSSFCLIPESTQEALPQHAKDECPGSKQEGTQVEDPEERPLPTLLKRQQQPAQKQRQPDPHLRDGVVHRQPEQVQQQPIKTIKHPEGSTERECGTPVEAYVQGKWEDADERPCRAVGQTKLNTSADMPADRRWRFNDLWACLSHGFPPPPALRPIIRVRDKGCDDVLSVTNSSFISEYESELPCQTILLPHASERATPTVDKRQQCVTRHIETFSKDGWLPSSQMESLEVSTAHTHMPEENGRLIRQEQELCETFVPWVEGGGQYGGIGLANETAILMARKGTDDSRLELSNAHQERQPLMPPADADFSGSKNGLRESRLCSINDKQICRALSVDAAPLRLQQLRQWDSQIRQRYTVHIPPKERCFNHLQAVANQTQPQGSPKQNSSRPRAQERFKSRLSWEADTALPLDEGFLAQSHVTTAEVNTLGRRPFAPLLQAPVAPTSLDGHNPSTQATLENSSPTPSKPPSKHALPLHISTRSSSVNATNKKSRLARAFLGVMLPRSNSRTRQ